MIFRKLKTITYIYIPAPPLHIFEDIVVATISLSRHTVLIQVSFLRRVKYDYVCVQMQGGDAGVHNPALPAKYSRGLSVPLGCGAR